MTEAEWLASTNPQSMLECLETRANDRKLRLYAVACWYRLWHLIPDQNDRQAIKTSEDYADGRTSKDALHTAWQRAKDVARVVCLFKGYDAAFASGMHARAVAKLRGSNDLEQQETLAQCELLRDIFGNPFQTLVFEPVWRSDDVTSLARSIYDRKCFGAMENLGQLLQRRGCNANDILSHCQAPPESHVRGCRVLDSILDWSVH